MVLGKLPVSGRPTIWITVGQGPSALVVGAGGGCLDIFTLIYPFCPLSPSLWETAQYRLKYCLKGPLNPRQPTNKSKVSGRSFGPILDFTLNLLFFGSLLSAQSREKSASLGRLLPEQSSGPRKFTLKYQ